LYPAFARSSLLFVVKRNPLKLLLNLSVLFLLCVLSVFA
jgi:hypothetical protein